MRRLFFFFFAASCAGKPATNAAPADASSSTTAAVVASPACVAAREARKRATELDSGGHESLAIAKLDEANAQCPEERASTMALEANALANVGLCAKVRELAPANAAATTSAVTTCAAREAPSTGTEATMRAKMHEAYAAERAKDYARAKSLYLDAWTEHHPNTRALERAARMAELAGDAAEGRRVRDRALVEAEASEHAIAELTQRVRVTKGSPRMIGGELLLGDDGKIVARDPRNGEVRVLLDVASSAPLGTVPSPYGSIATVAIPGTSTVAVYDALTGALLFKMPSVTSLSVSADDKFISVRDDEPTASTDDGHGRVYDVATGAIKAKLTGKWNGTGGRIQFAGDDAHVFLFDNAGVFQRWDLDKGAFVGNKLTAAFGVSAVSPDGHMFAYLENQSDGVPIHVRDMTNDKELTQLSGRFHSVSALAVTNDGKYVATGSYSSLRIWDALAKKQLYVHSHDNVGTQTDDDRQWSFSDDGTTMVRAGLGHAVAWDLATGAETDFVTDEPTKKILRFTKTPDGGVAIVLEDEVRIVPENGAPRSVCKGMKPLYFDEIGPTNVAFSPSGKSFACAMSDGWVHVLDTTTWTERAVIKKGPAAPKERPVDLAFTDDSALRVVSNSAIVTYDATSGAQTKRVDFKRPSMGLAPRHARFDDGTIAVRTWSGSAALFDDAGAYVRDVKLAPQIPMDAPDDFSADGKTYVAAVGKQIKIVDLASGDARAVDLASAAKSVAVSRDGKTILVASADGTVSQIAGATATPLANAKGTRAWLVGKSIAVARSSDVVELFTPGATATTALEIVEGGLVARDATGAFEARGKPELECVVGKTFLSRETCADRARDDLVAAWIRAAR